TSSGLYRSRDAGTTWATAGSGLPRADLSGLAAGPRRRPVFASDFAHGGVFRSGDAGATWERVTEAGLASDRIWMLALDPARPDRLLAAARAGGLHGLGLAPLTLGDLTPPAAEVPASVVVPASSAS